MFQCVIFALIISVLKFIEKISVFFRYLSLVPSNKIVRKLKEKKIGMCGNISRYRRLQIMGTGREFHLRNKSYQSSKGGRRNCSRFSIPPGSILDQAIQKDIRETYFIISISTSVTNCCYSFIR